MFVAIALLYVCTQCAVCAEKKLLRARYFTRARQRDKDNGCAQTNARTRTNSAIM